ncbi:galactose mutarotase [Mariniblastus sp.]|nr:galactose mutarotase [Mariniblastus sp.]
MSEFNSMTVARALFGQTSSGTKLHRFTCTNQHGYSIELIDYGATLTAVRTPDRHGKFDNIVLGCDDIESYERNACYLGSLVGRVCNRIANGKFCIDGIEHSLNANDGLNHLHGGPKGFDKLVWTGEPIEQKDAVGVRFKLISECGDEGYPGRLDVTADYLLSNGNELTLQLEATTDKSTHVNLTGHSYWNLGGAGSGSIRDHELMINADHFLPVNENLVPTGQRATVANSPLDFRTPKPIGRDLDSLTNDPIGYDHCYVLNQATANSEPHKLQVAATAIDPGSGRKLEILTNQPGVQFYTGNFLDGQPSSNGFQQHSAFCLETQGLVDAANQPGFPTTRLNPGETYRHTTVHRFCVVE